MIETAIDEILSNETITNKIFLGVFARDELPFQPPYPSCLIFNTAPREHSGQHWFALYYDQNGKCNFFDPYGMPAVNFNMTSYLKKLQIIGKRIKSVCRVSLIIVDIIVFYIYFLALVLKEPFFSQLYLIAHKK
jgi:hypothetical protein